MPQNQYLKAEVIVDSQPLTEYPCPSTTSNPLDQFSFVCGVPDKEFKIKITALPLIKEYIRLTFPYSNHEVLLRAELSCDGVKISSKLIKDVLIIEGKRVSSNTILPMVFGMVNLTEDKPNYSDNNIKIENLGLIEVKCSFVTRRGLSSHKFYAPLKEVSIWEREKKGISSMATKFGGPINQKVGKCCYSKPIPNSLKFYFTFKYQTEFQLQMQDIIPFTPSIPLDSVSTLLLPDKSSSSSSGCRNVGLEKRKIKEEPGVIDLTGDEVRKRAKKTAKKNVIIDLTLDD